MPVPAFVWCSHCHDFFVHLCVPLWTRIMTLRFLFRGFFHFFIFHFFFFFSILCCSFLDGPHFQRKKFLVRPPPLLISMHCTLWVSLIAWCSGVPSFFFLLQLLFRFQFHGIVYLLWLDVDRGREDVMRR